MRRCPLLPPSETKQFAGLLEKAEWPLDPGVFHALMGMSVSVPIELGAFDRNGKILMVYRDDFEFKGWHLPGTVLRDNKNVSGAITRLVRSEVGVNVSAPIPLGWLESERDVHPTRHAVGLLHVCLLEGEYAGKGQFFDPENLPKDTLTHHKTIVAKMLKRMRDWQNGLRDWQNG